MKSFCKIASVAIALTLSACGETQQTKSNQEAALASAAARKPFIPTVDLTSDFEGGSYNLYSIAEDEGRFPEGIAFIVPGTDAGEVSAGIVAFVPENGDTCSVRIGSAQDKVKVTILAELEIDSGNCDVVIQLKDGRKAKINVHNVGT